MLEALCARRTPSVAPRRSSSAFVAIVVPCVKRSTALRADRPSGREHRLSWCSRVGTFAVRTSPSETSTASVKVPPTSIPSARIAAFSASQTSPVRRGRVDCGPSRLPRAQPSHRTRRAPGARGHARSRRGALSRGRGARLSQHLLQGRALRVPLRRGRGGARGADRRPCRHAWGRPGPAHRPPVRPRGRGRRAPSLPRRGRPRLARARRIRDPRPGR